ncbi:1-acyl-sn-glycerol-3-phosphate acyltransferase [Clostridium sp. DJ247]|uniref:lysophospholipid acyltransferase family protein n=1 Tax=Clostridium sp. DJ247 TaxID=2726188 RepID=UPI0016252D80|nr:lysophospholipid acyltransferase family protein [Clostridium sp. DJ247]
MKTCLFYLDFFIYMLLTLFKKSKLESLRKYKSKEEVECYINKVAREWALHVLGVVGAKVHVIGKENIPNETCLYVANHQGYLDIPILMSSIGKPVGFIAKKEILKVKIVSYWMKQLRCIFMDRDNVRESIKSINEGIDNLNNGYNMAIFPEGTRSKGPKIGEFKKGSMKLALKSGVPIVPVAIDGSYKLREGNKNGYIKSGEVKVTICKPVYPKELLKEEQANLAEYLRDIISEKITIEK